MPLTPPSPPPSPTTNQDVQNTTVSFAQSRKAIKAFHSSLKRENATLSENKENIPPKDDEATHSRHCLDKETGHHEVV